MKIGVGDLVECRNNSQKVGIVVERKTSNNGFISAHAQKIMSNCPFVYYVFFSEEGCKGPFHNAELALKQALPASMSGS